MQDTLLTKSDVYDDGVLRVEFNNYYVECEGESLSLNRTEFLILAKLALNQGRPASPQSIWEHIWKGKKRFNLESLKVFISRLRRKLSPHSIKIETTINVGYRLVRNRTTSS